MELLLMSIAQLLLGFTVVGMCVLLWASVYAWFADNRALNNSISRSKLSWNTEHEFFDTITEFQNDFS